MDGSNTFEYGLPIGSEERKEVLVGGRFTGGHS